MDQGSDFISGLSGRKCCDSDKLVFNLKQFFAVVKLFQESVCGNVKCEIKF